MIKNVNHFFRVTPSATTPGDTNLSDVTGCSLTSNKTGLSIGGRALPGPARGAYTALPRPSAWIHGRGPGSGRRRQREAEEAVAYVLHTTRSWAQFRASPADRPQSEQIWCSQVMRERPRDLRQFGKGGTPSRTSHATRRTVERLGSGTGEKRREGKEGKEFVPMSKIKSRAPASYLQLS